MVIMSLVIDFWRCAIQVRIKPWLLAAGMLCRFSGDAVFLGHTQH